MPKSTIFLFAGLCAVGAATLLFFAESAAVQSAPAYSTLNAGPEGARLLFDGLSRSGLVAVSRQFKSVALQKPRNSAVLFLGTDPYDLIFADDAYFDQMEQAAALGNRLVIAVADAQTGYLFKGKNVPELSRRWGVEFVSNKQTESSSIQVDKNWDALTAAGPSVWQRKFGNGSIVLVAHTQRLTNKEVAQTAASRQLLQDLITGYPLAVFEESHLGIGETGSIAGLARHYHLQGLLGGLIIVAILFVWYRSVSFPPAAVEPEKVLLGSDNRALLAELMSQHLKGQLISACVAEWNRTQGHATTLSVPAISDVVGAYRSLQEGLQAKTKFKL